MCSNSKKQCTLTTIKIFGVLLIINLLLTVLGIEYAPLYWISNFTYDSLPLEQATELTNSNIEKWALRGQIGDIMSGHFSALAVLAVAYSITLQVEANQKMAEAIEKQKEALKQTQETIFQQKISIEKQTEANLEQAKSTLQQAKAIELQAKSIEQQNEALKVQSETLKAQIEELTESRKESEKQTEEFYIQNMNVTLDRYYKFLYEELDKMNVKSPESYKQYVNNESMSEEVKKDKIIIENNIQKISNILKSIYFIINDSKHFSDKAYNMFLEELTLRLNSSIRLSNINQYCPELLDKDIVKLFN
ncbi:hypothetical protein Q6A84_00660 [Aliarcobacter skirrowii]|uniref:hypothetical protein n=1 Tax=Aliarcobacter skirrowii TaxID=28200 RepID=UPI0029BD09D5|nr:hypothetical protein [Aliarcobacter skirrowii]MDX4062700.1 hypothetical protein [Aliarcobacter skirrowii]